MRTVGTIAWSLAALAMAALLTSPLAAGHHEQHGKDIVDTAVSAGSFQTLVSAVQAAGLVDALKGDGPLTVFAPTDEAFSKLPEGTLDSLLQPENREKLTAILTYHVVPGRVMVGDVSSLTSGDTLQGDPLSFEVKDGKVFVNGVQVVQADVAASNGVIHVIDQVLLPAGD